MECLLLQMSGNCVNQNEDPYTLVSDKLRTALGEKVTDQVFLKAFMTWF
jgi:hypothetical protein